MYLVDTNVVSELRKKTKMNTGVKTFFEQVAADNSALYLSVVTVGELRRGIELVRHRGDGIQAQQLERWLDHLLAEYEQCILPFDREEAQIWGKLRVPKHENAIDKQIAATALLYDLTVVTRNVNDFEETGVKLINPFT